jgi:hypothetical protein
VTDHRSSSPASPDAVLMGELEEFTEARRGGTAAGTRGERGSTARSAARRCRRPARSSRPRPHRTSTRSSCSRTLAPRAPIFAAPERELARGARGLGRSVGERPRARRLHHRRGRRRLRRRPAPLSRPEMEIVVERALVRLKGVPSRSSRRRDRSVRSRSRSPTSTQARASSRRTSPQTRLRSRPRTVREPA